ncbi:MAG TPA: FHA domain-containing protein [Xanthomonadaceae bacterium]|nr:FHA domain-containing protein [Xanthomonadaceae bacterium]
MPLRLIALPPERAALVRVLDGDGPWTIGRDPGCQVVLDHASISRRHAELASDGNGYLLRDLGSRNGVYVDGLRVDRVRIRGPAWCLLGDVFCELEAIAPDQLESALRRERARRETSRALTGALDASAGEHALLSQVMDSVVELVQAERGFLLLRGARGGLHVVATHGIAPDESSQPLFAGSAGAVERALRGRRPVISHDLRQDAALGARPSVVSAGLAALVAVPLLEADRCIGAVYADSTVAGKRFTELDLDLLQAFCERAGLMLAALDLRARLDRAGAAALPGITRFPAAVDA